MEHGRAALQDRSGAERENSPRQGEQVRSPRAGLDRNLPNCYHCDSGNSRVCGRLLALAKVAIKAPQAAIDQFMIAGCAVRTVNKQLHKQRFFGNFFVRRLLRTIGFLYLCLVIFAVVGSDEVIFQPQPSSYQDTPEILKLRSGGGRVISGCHLVNPGAKYTVLYSHGNAEDLGDLRDHLEEYRDQGFSVLAYDYSGYGTSEGKPTARRACEDAEAALEYLVEEKKIPLDRIILHGRSVGGGPALYLAEKNDVAGLIVESSFVTAFRVITRVPLVPFDKYRNISRISRVNCPVLVIHGRQDEVIPFWHGETLYRRAREPKQFCWLDQSTHNYMPDESRKIAWTAILSFAESIDSSAIGRD